MGGAHCVSSKRGPQIGPSRVSTIKQVSGSGTFGDPPLFLGGFFSTRGGFEETLAEQEVLVLGATIAWGEIFKAA